MEKHQREYWIIGVSALMGVLVGSIFDNAIVLFVNDPKPQWLLGGYIFLFLVACIILAFLVYSRK